MSSNDKILIKNLRIENKIWSSIRLLSEFPTKGWSRSGLDSLLRRIHARGSSKRKVGSGHRRMASTSSGSCAEQWSTHRAFILVVTILDVTDTTGPGA